MDRRLTSLILLCSALLCCAQPLTPSELAWPDRIIPGVITNGLTLWLKADQGTLGEDLNPSTNNGTVLRWEDQGVGGLDVIGEIGNLPVWLTNSLNGLPVVRFESGHELTNETVTAAQPLSCFMVARLSLTNATTIQLFVSSVGSFGIPSFGFTSSSNLMIWSTTGLTNGAIPSGFSLIAYSYNGAGSYIRINGAQVAAGTTTTDAWNGWIIQADSPLILEMAEIIRYENIVLTPTQVLAAELYLRNKWGL